ncbi:PHP domain-containing protein [Candidatus Hydrogenedentota bacterium]
MTKPKLTELLSEFRNRLIEFGENSEGNRRKALAALYEDFGKKSVVEIACGTELINSHIHTNHSWSLFKSPSEAVWCAYRLGIHYYCISDHFNMNGYPEFVTACETVDIHALTGMEAVVIDAKTQESGELWNDPSNAGRIYFCMIGTRREVTDPDIAIRWNCLRAKLVERVKAMLELYNKAVEERDLGDYALTMEQIVGLGQPDGTITERHMAELMWNKLSTESDDDTVAWLRKMDFDPDESKVKDPVYMQNLLRGIFKQGGLAFVAEDPSIYFSLEQAVELAEDIGAIACYPILIKPVTSIEEDLDALAESLWSRRIYAIQLIESRTDVETMERVLHKFHDRGFLVSVGTEHNTPDPELPLVTPEKVGHPEVNPLLVESAKITMLHQSRAIGNGYVETLSKAGDNPTCEDAKRIQAEFLG